MGRSDLELRPVLYALHGPQQGELFPLDRQEMIIGRGKDADVRFTDEGVSRSHARVTIEGSKIFVEDLPRRSETSGNGTLSAERIELREGDCLFLGRSTVLKFARIDTLEERALRTLFDSARQDPLTRVSNRRYFDERLRSELSFAQRHGSALALLLIDIDHFKGVNDAFGHQAGDCVLKLVAVTLQGMMRPEDVVARFGGEEFIVVARGLSLRDATVLGERIRLRISETHALLPMGDVAVTVSVGVAWTGPGHACRSTEDLIASADSALYRAKHAGRNQVRASLHDS